MSGPLVFQRGYVFDTQSGRTLRLTEPPGAGQGVSSGLVGPRAYAMDGASQVWSQPL